MIESGLCGVEVSSANDEELETMCLKNPKNSSAWCDTRKML